MNTRCLRAARATLPAFDSSKAAPGLQHLQQLQHRLRLRLYSPWKSSTHTQLSTFSGIRRMACTEKGKEAVGSWRICYQAGKPNTTKAVSRTSPAQMHRLGSTLSAAVPPQQASRPTCSKVLIMCFLLSSMLRLVASSRQL